MNRQFSQKLVDRLTRYMQHKHGLTITPEEADEWLQTLADTVFVFSHLGGVSGDVPRPELHDSFPRAGTRAEKSHEVATPARPEDKRLTGGSNTC